MPTLSIDIETYSSLDISACGAHRYVEAPDFEVLLLAYSLDYGPVQLIDLALGDTIPAALLAALTDPDVTKTAYNAAFERTALAKYLSQPLPPEQWSCTMVLAAQAGLPLGLDAVGQALDHTPDKAKDKSGKELIRFFCRPCKPTQANGGRTRNRPEDAPDKWQRFCEYCCQDVVAENSIRQTLLCYQPDATEQTFWCLDQRINDRGVLIDRQLAVNAITCDTQYKAALKTRLSTTYGLDNPGSDAQVKAWLAAEEGLDDISLNKNALQDLLPQLQSQRSHALLHGRSQLRKTSSKKYDAMLRAVCDDGRIRGLFQFYGAARTGRFAGRLVQLQNLPQNHMPDLAEARGLLRAGRFAALEAIYDDLPTVISELIRTTLIPEPGSQFLVCDFSAIEARVIAWLAGESWVLEEFRGEGKIYEATASQMFGVPKERIVKGNPEYELRSRGKVATLACGYSGSVGAIRNMDSKGILKDMPDDEVKAKIIDRWRTANPHIVQWWYSLERAAKRAILGKTSARDELGGIIYQYAPKGPVLFAQLPSGRKIAYWRPRIGTNAMGRQAILYDGLDQATHKWTAQETYYGKLAENIVQATARDCLRDKMLALDAAGYRIVMHVHDEIIIEEPLGGRSMVDVEEIMRAPLSWAPDLPLNAAGFATKFYRKD